MAYVAVRGGEAAIDTSVLLLEKKNLGDGLPLELESIRKRLWSLADQIMSESSLYDPLLAALAIKQGGGSPEEAVFLLRAFRSTVPRKFYTRLVLPENMRVSRRISSSFKEIPGGQILGGSPDYSHRILDFSLVVEDGELLKNKLQHMEKELKKLVKQSKNSGKSTSFLINNETLTRIPKVADYLRKIGFLRHHKVDESEPDDITKKILTFPTTRSQRLQTLTRGQTGAVTALAYASLRGYGGGNLHPTVGELRVGTLPLYVPDPLSGEDPEDDYFFGEIEVTEVESLVPFVQESMDMPGKTSIEFDLGYGICFGQNDTKAIAMSILDSSLERPDPNFAVSDEEFVLLHIDCVEATGFISHLKLPHYVTFQAKLNSLRKVKEENS